MFLRNFHIQYQFTQSYLHHIPAVKHLSSFTFQKPVTFFSGENGTGKSTLLEALAVVCGFNPEGGTRNFNFGTKDSHSTLFEHIKITKGIPYFKDGFFLRAESFYNVATEIDRLSEISMGGNDLSGIFTQSNYGASSLHHLSHGESFMSLVTTRFKENSLFFLDEPESALSPTRQIALLLEIDRLVNANCQFIIATHSPILLAYHKADIIELTQDYAKVLPYEETENYITMKQFINHTQQTLHHLFNDEDEDENKLNEWQN